MNHLCGFGIFEAGARDRRDRLLQEISRAVHRVHVLVNDPPHVAALAAENPLDAKAFRFGIDLGVEALDHFVGCEEAEVSAFGGIGAERVIQADFMEEHQVSHAGVCSRIGKIIAGRRDKEDVGAFFVDGNIHADACPVYDIVGHEFQHVLDAAGLNAQVVSRPEAVGRRFDDPVDVAAHQIEKLAADHGDFRLVDAVGAEDGTAAALRALVEVIEPFLQDIYSQVPCAGKSAEEFARRVK